MIKKNYKGNGRAEKRRGSKLRWSVIYKGNDKEKRRDGGTRKGVGNYKKAQLWKEKS